MLRQSLHALLSNLLRSVKLCFTWVFTISQRASNAFNQVVEAKRFEGVFLCKKKYAIFKNQTLKKSAGTQKCCVQRNTLGVGNFSN